MQWMSQWRSRPVLIIGDVMLDRYLKGHSDRLSREAPIPVVNVGDRLDYPGGAANTAANIASLGGQAILLSAIGADEEGHCLQQVLQDKGIVTDDLVIEPQRVTLAKQRIVAESHLLIRLDQGTTAAIAPETEQQIIDRLITRFSQCDAVIVSDYGYGILTPRIIETLAKLQAESPRIVAIDSKSLARYQSVGATLVKPNYPELLQLLNLPKHTEHRSRQIQSHGASLLKITGASIVAATLDTEGAVIFERQQSPFYLPTQPAPAHHTCGAGDTFISAFTLALTAGASTPDAATLATTAAAIVVTQPETTTCHLEDLQRFWMGNRKVIWDLDHLSLLMQGYRANNRRIVFTNGCFDILHAGHISYLTQAKALGDVLIVGVNADASVQQLKGRDRPVNPLSDRLTVLAALTPIDHLIPFSDLTPAALLHLIRPDVYVKGGDYTEATLPEAQLVRDLGGTVEIMPYLSDRSTTRLIQQLSLLQQ